RARASPVPPPVHRRDGRRLLLVPSRTVGGTRLAWQYVPHRIQGLHPSGTSKLMQTRRSPEVHDVVIIGSGASGGMAAWNLTRQGMKVLMLDAGAKFERSQFWSHVKPWQAPGKIAAGQRPPEFYVDLKTAPYRTPPGQPFDLVRVWGRGGKTNVWGRVSLRYSDLDFAGAERDGWEIPWPIRYKDIAPYYDKV